MRRPISAALAALVVCLAAPIVLSGGALASGSPTDVVAVHQDADGALWFNWYDQPPNKRFVGSAHPCWVDHDHIRLGGWGREGCAATRPPMVGRTSG